MIQIITCFVFHKIAFINDFFPSFANPPCLADLLKGEDFKYSLNHFRWQVVKVDG